MKRDTLLIIIKVLLFIMILWGIFYIKTNYADAKTKWKYRKDTYTCTAYCPCYKCSGSYGGTTSTGKKATAGHTIAVDPHTIPYGTKVKIKGKWYTAEDCGGAIKGKRIDIYFNSHQEALQFGRQTLKVKIRTKAKKARRKK